MSDLNPCPFCGGEAEYFEDRLYSIAKVFWMGVKCTKCGCKYSVSDINKCPNDVKKMWNRRVNDETD